MTPMHDMSGNDMKANYRNLAIMLTINGVIMFFFMYAMVDTTSHVYLNLNTLYMTLIMLAPMGILMLLYMRSMYKNKKLNMKLYILCLVLTMLPFYFIRAQSFVGDRQFLRSMIPHHAGAILMCQEAEITDPDIQNLCRNIVQSQQQEISQMQTLLKKQ